MISGVSVESYTAAAAYAAVTGAWSTDYPVTNLRDLIRSSNVARVTPASGAAAFTAVLAADSAVQCLALVNHGLPAGATVRFRGYGDAAMTSLVFDSAVQAAWIGGSLPVAGYRSVRPFLLAQDATVRAVRVDLAGLTGATDIGGLEVSRFWEWPGISPGVEFGFRSPPADVELAGGGSEGQDQVLPITYSGQIDYLPMKIAATRGLDFQKIKGAAQPFIFVEDYEDPGSWPRSCFLARNKELPSMVGAMYRHDTFPFRLVEHLR